MKLDRFTWVVIFAVTALLVAAVVTVNATNGSGYATATYLEEDSPSATVYNAFLAFQNGDITKARAQYSTRVIEETTQQMGYSPFTDRFSQNTPRRLRIVSAEIDNANPNHAYVSVAMDTYSSSGLFGTGSTWTRNIVIETVREDGVWRIDTPEYFY
jgi:hypothetical protein